VIERIVSGGQTGVDRAALDVGSDLGIPCGGWCPNERRAEDGGIAPRYPLRETPSARYAQRTGWNVRDADATLVVVRGALSGGTRYTVEVAKHLRKAVFVLDLEGRIDEKGFWSWMRDRDVGVLNVAGPRESQCPGIYAEAKAVFFALFQPLVEQTEFKQWRIQR